VLVKLSKTLAIVAGRLALVLSPLLFPVPATADPVGQPAQWIVVPTATATTGTLLPTPSG
jgi:hypothetical protein